MLAMLCSALLRCFLRCLFWVLIHFHLFKAEKKRMKWTKKEQQRIFWKWRAFQMQTQIKTSSLIHATLCARILFVRLSIRFALDFFFGFWTKVKVKFYFSTFAYMPNEYCILVLVCFGGWLRETSTRSNLDEPNAKLGRASISAISSFLPEEDKFNMSTFLRLLEKNFNHFD